MASQPITSELDIFNAALTLIGQPTLTSPSEESASGRRCRSQYAGVRDAILQEHTWNCAIQRVSLTLLTDTPAWGYSYQFQLPTDWLRPERSEDRDDDFKIEGRKLLANSSTFNITYVCRLTNVADMDEWLKQAIKYRLAAEICNALSGNPKLAESLMLLYQETVDKAKLVDAASAPLTTMTSTRWVEARDTGIIAALDRPLPSDGNA